MQARAADEAGIQFRMLNASKGPAVRGPRAQMDRSLYKAAMQRLVRQQPNLAVHDGAVTDLILEMSNGQAAVSGVALASGTRQPNTLDTRKVPARHRALPERTWKGLTTLCIAARTLCAGLMYGQVVSSQS